MKHVQTLKLEVTFPSVRDADRVPLKTSNEGAARKGAGVPAVWHKLWGLQRDLTRAANRLISAAWLVKSGVLSLPVEAPRRPKAGQSVAPKAWPLSSALYRGMNGEWRPFGDAPIYAPENGPEACGGVLSATVQMVETRIKTDWLDVTRGEQSLPTFKHLPICLRNSDVELEENGAIRLHVFAGRAGGWVIVRPKKTDPSTAETLRRCFSGRYKHGSATLKWVKPEGRRGRWMLSISYSEERPDVVVDLTPSSPDQNQETPRAVVAGVDVGIQHAAWVAYLDAAGAPLRGRPDVVQFPDRTLRAVARVSNERRQRLSFNRMDLGVREGRGRHRKLRATDKISDKVQRLTETMIEQIAADVVNRARARRVQLLVVEEHADFPEQIHRRADRASTRSEAAKIRNDFFRLHNGLMREKLLHAATRDGLKAITVDAAWTSRTCHRCGLIWRRFGLHAPPDAPEEHRATGRFELRRFRCLETVECPVLDEKGKIVESRRGCGHEGHADHNAAINIGRLGLRAERGEEAPAIAPVRGRRK